MSLIVDHLYLSNVKTSKCHKFFKNQQISHVLIAAKNLKRHFEDINYKKLLLHDNPKQDIAKHFVESIEFIHEAISSQKNILVHCLGGKSRSVTLVVAYVMLIKRLSFKKAFEYVKSQHHPANPNPGFIQQLKLFEDCVVEYYEQISEEAGEGFDFKALEKLVLKHFGEKPSKAKKDRISVQKEEEEEKHDNKSVCDKKVEDEIENVTGDVSEKGGSGGSEAKDNPISYVKPVTGDKKEAKLSS